MSPLLGGNYYYDKSLSLNHMFGNFVLISDNFAIESFGHDECLNYKSQFSQFASDDRLSELLSMNDRNISNATAIRDRFSKLILSILSSFPNVHFILRPHPVSNPNYWHSKLHNFRNLTVICHDSCEPWIFSASAVLHSGCTMGIQSLIAKVPDIDVSRIIGDDRSALSSTVSRSTPSNFSDLSKFLTSYTSEKSFNSNNKVSLDDFSSFDLNSFLSQNLSLSGLHSFNSLVSKDLRIPSSSLMDNLLRDSRTFFSQYQDSSFSTYSKLLHSSIQRLPKLNPNYVKSKFWSFTEIASKLSLVHSTLSKFSSGFAVSLKRKHSPNVFIIQAKRL